MPRIKYYIDGELCQLWKAFDRLTLEDRWHKYIEGFRLMLTTGAREFEAAALKVSDCHELFIEIQKGKGGKYRNPDVHPLGLPYYHAYLRERQARNREDWMFPSGPRTRCTFMGRENVIRWRNLRPVSTRHLRRKWAEFCEEINLRNLGLHGLRRTFTTWMAEELSPTDMMDQLGHTDYRTTNEHYRASIPGRKFSKPKPEWKRLAEAYGQRFLEGQGVTQIRRIGS